MPTDPLVRENLGNWQWVAVGEYRYQQDVFADFGSRIALLRDKLWVAFVLFLVGVASISAPYRPFTDWRLYIFGLFYWGGWVIANYFTNAPNSFLSFTGLLIVPLAFVSWFSLFQIANHYYDCLHERHDTRRIFAIVAGFSLFASCRYLLPYLFWLNGTIPQFRFAWEFSIILAILSVYAFGTWIRRRYFAHLKKQPPKEINSRTTLEDLFDPDDSEA
ncbi:MAG: hypothetical protein RLP44_01665 [Aggregatilineales bacterium]